MYRHGLLIIWISISLVLSACRGSGIAPEPVSSDTDVVTIKFAAPEGSRLAYAPLIRSFNAEHPNIQVEFVSPEEEGVVDPTQEFDPNELYRQRLSIADTAQVSGINAEQVQQGLFYELGPLMDADPTIDLNDFYPGAQESATVDGALYMLPHVIEMPLLSYNRDLWSSSGLPNPDPNWSWSDITAAAKQLARKRGDEIDVYGLFSFTNAMLEFVAEVESAGIPLLDTPVDQVRLDTPEVVAALERVANQTAAGAIYADPEIGEAVDLPQLIRDQRVGIWMSDLFPPNSTELEFDTGTTIFPEAFPFLSRVRGYAISSNTQHPQAAWRWIEFLSRQTTGPFSYDSPNSRVPARLSVAEEIGYWQQLDEEATAAVTTALNRTMFRPSTNILFHGQSYTILMDASAAVVSGEQSATEALTEAQIVMDMWMTERWLKQQLPPDTE